MRQVGCERRADPVQRCPVDRWHLLLTIVAVEYGGTFMLRVVRGRVPMTPFQRAFARAGHAHAGVLVLATPICQVVADAADLSGFQGTLARDGGVARCDPVSGRVLLLLDGERPHRAQPVDLAPLRPRGRVGGKHRRPRDRPPALAVPMGADPPTLSSAGR